MVIDTAIIENTANHSMVSSAASPIAIMWLNYPKLQWNRCTPTAQARRTQKSPFTGCKGGVQTKQQPTTWSETRPNYSVYAPGPD